MRKPRSSTIRLGRSILIAALLVIATGSSVAIALERARRSTTIAPGSFGMAVAKCHGGRTAVSSGFAAPGFDPNGGATVGRLASTRIGKHQMKTRALNFGSQAGELVSFAYCALNDHGLHVRSASTQVQPNTQGSAIADCPRGTIAVGGGFGTPRFSTDQGPQIITLTSRRLGERHWKVVGVNIKPDSGEQAGTLIARAYCAAAPFELVTRSKEVTPPLGALQTFDVRCPNGSGAYSGGFDGNVQLQGNQAGATVAITSKRASGGRVWRTSALSIFDSGPGRATAYAYCRER